MCWSDLSTIPLFPPRSVVIVGGSHGAGKSTLCQKLTERQSFPWLSPQRVESTLGTSSSKPDVLRKVREQITDLLNSKTEFYFEHVMSGHYISKLIEQAKEASFSVHLVYLNLTSEMQAIQRVHTRVESGGHQVDAALIGARLMESRRNFWLSYRHLVDTWMLFDTSEQTELRLASGKQDEEDQVFHAAKYEQFVLSIG